MRFFRSVPRVTIAGPDDAPALTQLLTRSGLGPSAEDLQASLRGGFEVYKATLEGEVVGMVRCAFPTGACVIDQLVVDAGHRRRGFGQYLAEHAVSRARRAGAPKAWMQVPADEDGVLRLLHRLGFKEAARLERNHRPLLLVELSL